jgi:hypothetical protein
VNANDVLNGIDAGDRIAQGMFFRLTFGRTRRLGIPIEFFSFQTDVQAAFDELDAGSSLAQPVSDLTVAPGQEAAVFDILVRPAAIGVTAAYLANYLDGLRFGISLTSMTLVDVAAVQGGAGERDTLQAQLDEAEKARDPLAVLGDYAKYLRWILILLVIVALLYYGQKAFKLVKAVV